MAFGLVGREGMLFLLEMGVDSERWARGDESGEEGEEGHEEEL